MAGDETGTPAARSIQSARLVLTGPVPVHKHGRGETHGVVVVAVGPGPLEGGHETGVIGIEPTEVRRCHPVRLGDRPGERDGEERVAVGALRLGRSPGGGQLGGGIGADRLGEVVAKAGVCTGRADERLVHQTDERCDGVGAGHGPDGAQVECAGDDGEAMEHVLFGGRQQVVAPIDGRPQRPVPRRGRAGSVAQGGEAVVELFRQFLGAKHPGAGGGDLQSQGEPVEPAADPDHGIGVGIVEGEVAVDLTGPGAEQRDRVERLKPFHRARLVTVVGGRQRERRDGEHRLAGDGQALPGGGQDGEPRARGEQRMGDRRRGPYDLFAVVEHDEQPPALKPLPERFSDIPA